MVIRSKPQTKLSTCTILNKKNYICVAILKEEFTIPPKTYYAPVLNQGLWNRLINYVRSSMKNKHAIYVGTVFKQKGSEFFQTKIAQYVPSITTVRTGIIITAATSESSQIRWILYMVMNVAVKNPKM